MSPILSALQIIFLIAAGVILFRVYRELKKLPQDEILGEERAERLSARLTALMWLAGIEAALTIAQIILRNIN